MKLSSPLTTPVLVDGLDAFCLGAFSALGLRVSRLDFIWPFAMIISLVETIACIGAIVPIARDIRACRSRGPAIVLAHIKKAAESDG